MPPSTSAPAPAPTSEISGRLKPEMLCGTQRSPTYFSSKRHRFFEFGLVTNRRERRPKFGPVLMPRITLTVNSKAYTITASADMPLLWVLRDVLGLKGTKYGCGIGVCGACTILEGQTAVRACQIPLADASGKVYITIEGLSPSGDHPCQRAWIEEDVSQCGYCQPGMILTAAALLARTANPSDTEIDQAMSGSVCRCGTYNHMRRAIHRAAGGKLP